jgi:hypothetical protein
VEELEEREQQLQALLLPAAQQSELLQRVCVEIRGEVEALQTEREQERDEFKALRRSSVSASASASASSLPPSSSAAGVGADSMSNSRSTGSPAAGVRDAMRELEKEQARSVAPLARELALRNVGDGIGGGGGVGGGAGGGGGGEHHRRGRKPGQEEHPASPRGGLHLSDIATTIPDEDAAADAAAAAADAAASRDDNGSESLLADVQDAVRREKARAAQLPKPCCLLLLHAGRWGQSQQ